MLGELRILVHTFNPSNGEAEAGTSLSWRPALSRMNYRAARTIQRNCVSGKNKTKQTTTKQNNNKT